jgi:hypothetical protein
MGVRLATLYNLVAQFVGNWGTPTLTWVIPSLYVVGRITSPSSARRRGKK